MVFPEPGGLFIKRLVRCIMRRTPPGGIMLIVSTRQRKASWQEEEDTPLSEVQERNKVLVRRFLEAQAKGDLDAVKEMMAPHFVDHNLRPGHTPDREGYLRVVAEEQAAFSDIRYIIEDQIAEDDKVMTRWTGSSVHDRAEYQGFAPTGRWWADKIIDVHRVERGKI